MTKKTLSHVPVIRGNSWGERTLQYSLCDQSFCKCFRRIYDGKSFYVWLTSERLLSRVKVESLGSSELRKYLKWIQRHSQAWCESHLTCEDWCLRIYWSIMAVKVWKTSTFSFNLRHFTEEIFFQCSGNCSQWSSFFNNAKIHDDQKHYECIGGGKGFRINLDFLSMRDFIAEKHAILLMQEWKHSPPHQNLLNMGEFKVGINCTIMNMGKASGSIYLNRTPE